MTELVFIFYLPKVIILEITSFSYSPEPIAMSLWALLRRLVMLPPFGARQRSHEKVRILLELPQTINFEDIGLFHLFAYSRNAAEAICIILCLLGLATRKEDYDVAFANLVPDIRSADTPCQRTMQLPSGFEGRIITIVIWPSFISFSRGSFLFLEA
ncbi:MAG: hypothetical protein QXQ39_05170 [Conexivisphaerales archaeon]